MHWSFIAIAAYFFGALTSVLDKFLLGSKRIASPAIYSFYVGTAGILAFLLVPFADFYVMPAGNMLLSLLGGLLFIISILFFYIAINKSQASQVVPLVGAITPVAAYLFSLFILQEYLSFREVAGLVLLILGGLLISFDLNSGFDKKKLFGGFYASLVSGIFLALSFSILKIVYLEETFLVGYIWSRVGAFLGAALLFLVPKWRTEIAGSFRGFKEPTQKNSSTALIFITNKALGGASSILQNRAIDLGYVALVNSLVSVQYVFILVMVFFASKVFPNIFEERITLRSSVQKIGAIALISAGIFYVV